MNTLEIISDLFFHAIIILSVFERLKKFYQSIQDYKNTKDSKKIYGELFILIIVIVISFFIYRFFIYK